MQALSDLLIQARSLKSVATAAMRSSPTTAAMRAAASGDGGKGGGPSPVTPADVADRGAPSSSSAAAPGRFEAQVDSDDDIDPVLTAWEQLEPQKQAQKVTRQLWLGPLQVASNPAFLGLLGVDSCVSLLADPAEFERVAAPRKALFQVEDSVDAELSMASSLAPAIEHIYAEIAAGHTVLVHCQSGISRSATAAIAYLMACRGYDLMAAYSRVFEKRPCINPNDGFFRALQQYECSTLGIEKDAAQRRADEQEYHAHQLASQLAFASVTLAHARRALYQARGDAAAAASELLETAGM
jgi:predicted protein tyrosine phosphatase